MRFASDRHVRGAGQRWRSKEGRQVTREEGVGLTPREHERLERARRERPLQTSKQSHGTAKGLQGPHVCIPQKTGINRRRTRQKQPKRRNALGARAPSLARRPRRRRRARPLLLKVEPLGPVAVQRAQLRVHRVAAQHPQEGRDLLQVPERVLHRGLPERAAKVDVEEVVEPLLGACSDCDWCCDCCDCCCDCCACGCVAPPAPPDHGDGAPAPPPCPPPPAATSGLLRSGRDSILVMSMSRSANTESALNSWPGPSRSEKTIDVL